MSDAVRRRARGRGTENRVMIRAALDGSPMPPTRTQRAHPHLNPRCEVHRITGRFRWSVVRSLLRAANLQTPSTDARDVSVRRDGTLRRRTCDSTNTDVRRTPHVRSSPRPLFSVTLPASAVPLNAAAALGTTVDTVHVELATMRCVRARVPLACTAAALVALIVCVPGVFPVCAESCVCVRRAVHCRMQPSKHPHRCACRDKGRRSSFTGKGAFVRASGSTLYGV